MKKFLMMAAVAAVALSSCNNGGGEVKKNLESDYDSLNYNLGLAQSEALRQYMQMQLGVDSAYFDDFIRGMKESALTTDSAQMAYMKGLMVGNDVKLMTQDVAYRYYDGDSAMVAAAKVDNVLAGLIEGLKRQAPYAADSAFVLQNKKFAELQDKKMLKEFGDNKKAGEDFIAAKAKEEGVMAGNGYYYKVLKEGEGAAPADTSIVKLNYEGRLINDTIFDSSYKDGAQPLEVNMANLGLIEGFAEAVKVMPKGAIWEIYIPQEKGYGSRNASPLIKPFSALQFKVEILDIK